MSFVPLNLLQRPPQNALGSLLGGAVGGFGAIQKLRAQNVLNQLHKAQAQSAQAQAGIAPQLAAAQVQNLPLARQLLQAQVKQTPAKTALLQAMAQRQQAMAKAPFGGKILPGQAGKVQAIEMIKQHFGVNSSQARDAERGRISELNLQKARADYYGSNVQFKYLPANVKNQRTLVYQKDMAQRQANKQPIIPFPDWLATHYPAPDSNIVHSNQPVQPTTIGGASTPTVPQTIPGNESAPDYSKMAEQTAGIIAKQTGDAKIRQRATAANNVLKILNNEDVDNIAKFAGIEGKLKYFGEAAKANVGIKPSQDYLNYRLFKKSQSKAIADAARLILQTSQRGSYVYKMLQPLADPTMETWGNSPAEVKMRLDFMKHFMADYANNLSKQALTGFTPNLVHQEQTGMMAPGTTQQPPSVPSPAAAGAVPSVAPVAPTGAIKIRLPDGRVGSVPANRLDEAIKMGAKRI